MGLKPALFWFYLVAILVVVWKLSGLPSEEETIAIVTRLLTDYGLVIIFVGSLLETLLFIGFYFPGSIIIFLGVALSPSTAYALKAVIVVSFGMLIGYSLNYLLGKHGWFRVFLKLGMKSGIDNAKIKMEKSDLRYIFYTYWNPGLAAFTSTAAGILQLPYKRFLMLMVLAIVVWNTFWGMLVYSLGEASLILLNFSVVLKVIGVWIIFEIGLFAWRKYKNS